VTRLDDISSHTNPLISNLVDQAILPLGVCFRIHAINVSNVDFHSEAFKVLYQHRSK